MTESTNYGVTDQGFVIKKLDDIQTEIQSSLRSTFGNGINLLATELLGQIVGILSEREALVWELAQAVYNSQYPDTANGVNLDNVASITAIERLSATQSTVSGIAYGTEGTVISQGAIVSVDGNSSARFLIDEQQTIGAGTDEVQTIAFDNLSDTGTWTLVYDGEETASLNFDADAPTIESALNNLTSLSGMTVSGDTTSGFTITFSGDNGAQSQPLLTVGANDLSFSGTSVNVTILETVAGVLPNVTCTLTAETAGAVQAPAETLTVIETVIAGWNSFTNSLDATVGREIETDAEYRVRRQQALAAGGSATLAAIRTKILEIDEVEACIAFHNITMENDVYGRPPKSIETVVLGGDDDDIANALWLVAPAGIELYGSTEQTIVDSQGFDQTIKFSRPTEIEIWLEVDLTTDSTFPTGGADSVSGDILTYVQENFGIGDDVITTRLYCPINDVAGITDITLRIGLSASPTTDDNISIDENQIASFDSSRITITIT